MKLRLRVRSHPPRHFFVAIARSLRTALVVLVFAISPLLAVSPYIPSAYAATPTVTSLSPNSSSTSGGISTTITGTNFTNTDTFSQVSSGGSTSCAVTTGGKIYCWGSNGSGQLGNNSTTSSRVPVAVDTSGVLSGKTVTRVSVSGSATCVVASSQAYCWGDGAGGKLGNNSTSQSNVPVAVDTSGVLSGKTVTDISSGDDATCAVASGKAYCWGTGTWGELGNNSTTDSLVPVAVTTTTMSGTVTQISKGGMSTCAVAASKAYCWGYNSGGQLGNNSTSQRNVPVAVNTSGQLNGKTVTQIAVTAAINSYTSVCVVATSKAYCWGNNQYGQLGNNSTSQSSVPVAVNTSGVLSGKTVTAVGATGYSFCVVASGTYCWGYNQYGQLGNNSTTNSSVPVAVDTSGVLSGKTVTQVSVGGGGNLGSTTCVVASSQPYCWGNGASGQLGNGTTGQSSVPVGLLPITPRVNFGSATSASVTYVNSTTLTALVPPSSAGAVSVTVTNPDGSSGSLANGFTYIAPPAPSISSISPSAGPTSGGTQVTINGADFTNDSPNFTKVSSGSGTSCGVTAAGTAYCWGSNSYGQLGNATTTDSSVPVAVNTGGVLSGKTVTDISVGGNTSCAVASGAVYCWGSNSIGQLGNNSTTDSLVPVAVDTSGVLSGKTVTQVSVDPFIGLSVCVTASGGAYCWGANNYGQLGNNSTTNSSVPVAVDTSGVLSGKTVTSINTNLYIATAGSCVIANGAAYCWGRNNNGQLGNNSTTDSLVPVAVDTSGVLSGKTVTSVSVSIYATCAAASGGAYCWGYGNYGQLGNNSTSQSLVPVAVDTSGVLNGKTVTQVSVGLATTCAAASGGAYCWGYGTYGQLGNNSTTQSNVPVAVDTSGVLNGKTVTQVSVGLTSTCSTASASPYCWGNGQLGDGSTSVSLVPVASDTSSIHSPSVTFGGTAATSVTYLSPTQIRTITPAKSAGAATVSITNPDGQSGNLANAFTYTSPYAGPALSSVSPNSGNIAGGTSVTLSGTNLAETAKFTQISSTAAGGGGTTDDQHSCGVTADGRAYCWGVNTNGQLGNGTTTTSSTPVPVTGPLSSKIVVQVATGGDTSCAITADNLIYCWGKNGSAQFGNGTWSDSSTPVATTMSGALNGKTITQITVGGDWACALASDGSAYCWGNNWNGRLGTGGTTDSSTPAAVTGGLSFISINAMASNTCGITTTYKTYCWGSNDTGQVGDNTTTQRTSPTPVSTSGVLSGVNLIQVYPLNSAACALSSVGNVYCWGGGWAGQLGNGGNSQSLVPVAVTMSGRTAVSIGGGRTQVCMVTTTSSVYCWGDNTYGQLGDGTTTARNVPTQMNTSSLLSGKTIIQVSTGNYDTCVLTLDQITACSGYNASGELGNNSITNSSSLVLTQNYALPYIMTFGGSSATNIAYVNQNTVTATTPAHAVGAVTVALTRSDGQSSTLTSGYTYTASVPQPPTGLATTPANNAVTLNWTAPSDNGGSAITDYYIEYSSNGGSTWSVFSHTASTATTQTVTGLAPGTTYTFRVSAINVVGTGSPSSTATGTPLYISAGASSTVSLGITPTTTARISSTSQNVTISTNAPNGYTITLSMSGSSQLLTNGGSTLTATSGTQGSPGSLVANTWGYRVDGIGGFGAGSTLTETNVSSSAFSWAGVPISGSGNIIANAALPGTGLTTTVWYAASANTTKQSGTYTGTVVYTAVTNP